MDALPDDVLQDVLALLDVRSLAAICVACRRAWLVTAERDSLYRPHCTLLYDYSILNRTRDQSFGQAFRRLRGEYGRYAPDKLDSPRPSIFARAKVHLLSVIASTLSLFFALSSHLPTLPCRPTCQILIPFDGVRKGRSTANLVQRRTEAARKRKVLHTWGHTWAWLGCDVFAFLTRNR